MNRLIDYNLTEHEILEIFGTQEKYERDLKWYEKEPGGDGEKYHIALVLFLRGKREESRKMLESIEDEESRQDCLEAYASWGAEPGWIVD